MSPARSRSIPSRGPGDVHRAIVAVQHRFFDPPDCGAPGRLSKYR
jgi:hypothetical protein